MTSLALTFDDGPDPVWTPRLLDLLEALDARATFFPIAPLAACHPELLERMAAAGHTVGLHCCQHVRHADRDRDWLRRDTAEALELLAAVGIRPAFWRPPWGDTVGWSSEVARDHGLRLIGWTVDTHDWRGDCATEMFEQTRIALEHGSIVLAHDGIGPGARRKGAGETLAYVRLVARHARAQGLSLEALS